MGEDYSRAAMISKILMLILFVTLPFVAFYLGIKYQNLVLQAEKGSQVFQQKIVCPPCKNTDIQK